jgi:co-chaperonin GroES (HSP10)
MHHFNLKENMNYQPLGNKLIVKDTERKEETDSGIYVGKTLADPRAKTGTVIAIGPLVETVKVGDIVYLQWSNIKAVKDGDTYLGVLTEDDVLAVLE